MPASEQIPRFYTMIMLIAVEREAAYQVFVHSSFLEGGEMDLAGEY